jgi:hypothetical protein
MSPEEAKERQKAARDMVHNMQMHSVQSCSDAGGCPPG